ncbi:MAG: hypothetical protein KGJ02_06990 [Verrucomicrobiota bacterium]|nr:hypothetical protein [Verrucomicrobiota bacterium]
MAQMTSTSWVGVEQMTALPPIPYSPPTVKSQVPGLKEIYFVKDGLCIEEASRTWDRVYFVFGERVKYSVTSRKATSFLSENQSDYGLEFCTSDVGLPELADSGKARAYSFTLAGCPAAFAALCPPFTTGEKLRGLIEAIGKQVGPNEKFRKIPVKLVLRIPARGRNDRQEEKVSQEASASPVAFSYQTFRSQVKGLEEIRFHKDAIYSDVGHWTNDAFIFIFSSAKTKQVVEDFFTDEKASKNGIGLLSHKKGERTWRFYFHGPNESSENLSFPLTIGERLRDLIQMIGAALSPNEQVMEVPVKLVFSKIRGDIDQRKFRYGIGRYVHLRGYADALKPLVRESRAPAEKK